MLSFGQVLSECVCACAVTRAAPLNRQSWRGAEHTLKREPQNSSPHSRHDALQQKIGCPVKLQQRLPSSAPHS